MLSFLLYYFWHVRIGIEENAEKGIRYDQSYRILFIEGMTNRPVLFSLGRRWVGRNKTKIYKNYQLNEKA